MSTHDRERDMDDLLREDGGEIGRLYRRLPRYEPPRRLDRAVLSDAARAVHSGKPPRRQRWIFGIGSAAGIVLAAGIAWRIGHDAMSDKSIIGPAREVVPVQPISESARRKHEDAAPAEAPAPAAATQAPAAARDEASGASPTSDAIRQSARKAKTMSKPAPATAAPPPPAPKQVPVPVEAPLPQAFPEAERHQREAGAESEESTRPYGNAANPAAQGATDDKRSQPAAGAARHRQGLSSPTPPSGSVELQRDMQLAPEAWLAHIRELMRQGRSQQATESLRLFRRTHPKRPIPDDLRPLLD